jgi:hypothetical protein
VSLPLWFLCLVFCVDLLPAAASAETLVAEFSGTGSRVTPVFEVESPWLLDWRVRSRDAFELGCEVSLEEAGTRIHRGRVLAVRGPGNGLRLFREGGRLQLRVDASFADWHFKIIQLTAEEAGRYQPKETDPAR